MSWLTRNYGRRSFAFRQHGNSISHWEIRAHDSHLRHLPRVKGPEAQLRHLRYDVGRKLGDLDQAGVIGKLRRVGVVTGTSGLLPGSWLREYSNRPRRTPGRSVRGLADGDLETLRTRGARHDFGLAEIARRHTPTPPEDRCGAFAERYSLSTSHCRGTAISLSSCRRHEAAIPLGLVPSGMWLEFVTRSPAT